MKYKPQILALAEKNKAENVRVFGSVVRGDATKDSDIDFLVHFKNDASYFDLISLTDGLEQLFNKPVDVVSDMGMKDIIAPFILAEATNL